MNAKCCQLFEYAVKAIVLRDCGASYLAVAAPENRDFMVLYIGHIISLITSPPVRAEQRQQTVPLRTDRVVKFRSENRAWIGSIRAQRTPRSARGAELGRIGRLTGCLPRPRRYDIGP